MSSIAIIDPDAAVRDSIHILLTDHGYKSDTYSSLHSFFYNLKDKYYTCIVLSDAAILLEHPIIDRLMQFSPTKNIIILADQNNHQVLDLSKKLDFQKVFFKPIIADKFITFINKTQST